MAESSVVIVGAGPSGLATAACLTQHSIPYILLEREDCFASLWKKKSYDRLHLHLPKQYCELPYMKFPNTFPKYAPKKDFIRYLDNYVAHFGINPLCGRRVVSARFDENAKRWRVRAKMSDDTVDNGDGEDEEEFVGRFLVVATGETSDPYCPEIQGLSSFQGKVVHSTEYKSGKEYEGKSVLVIGAGNSGFEIALDLANHSAKPSLVVRSPVHILSREIMNVGVLVKYLPLKWVDNLMVILSKLVYGDITKYGLTRPREGPFYMKAAYNRYPIIDLGIFHKIKSGEIQVLSATITNIRGNNVVFQDGKSYIFDAIIFATGFRRSTSQWLEGGDDLLNEDGFAKLRSPDYWKGENGLYCAGLATKGLYGASLEAEKIARDIKTYL